MEDWNASQHQWPSTELVSLLAPGKFHSPKESIARAVWNAVASFASASAWVEGGYMPMADNKGNLHDFFAGQIYPTLGFAKEGEASSSFGRMMMRDLTVALSVNGEPYGPPGRNSAFLCLDSGGQLMCMADLPGRARRSFIGVAVPRAA